MNFRHLFTTLGTLGGRSSPSRIKHTSTNRVAAKNQISHILRINQLWSTRSHPWASIRLKMRPQSMMRAPPERHSNRPEVSNPCSSDGVTCTMCLSEFRKSKTCLGDQSATQHLHLRRAAMSEIDCAFSIWFFWCYGNVLRCAPCFLLIRHAALRCVAHSNKLHWCRAMLIWTSGDSCMKSE